MKKHAVIHPFLFAAFPVLTAGIGLSNVNERLSVTYGANYQLKLTSSTDNGTCARFEIPLQAARAGGQS